MALFPRDTSGLEDLERFADRLPQHEVEIARLYLAGASQHAVAAKLGVSQSGIHHRLQKLRARLAVCRQLPDLDLRAAPRDLAFLSAVQRKHVIAFLETSSQIEAARRCGVQQGSVRRHILIAIERLEARMPNARLEPYLKTIRLYLANPCCLHGWRQTDEYRDDLAARMRRQSVQPLVPRPS